MNEEKEGNVALGVILLFVDVLFGNSGLKLEKVSQKSMAVIVFRQ